MSVIKQSALKAKEDEGAKLEARKRTMEELLRVQVQGKPFSAKRIPRMRMLETVLNKVYGVRMEYLMDDNGTIIFAKDMMFTCIKGVTYSIVQKPKEPPDVDPDFDDTYAGGSITLVTNVPISVPKEQLKRWLHAGLQSDNEELATAEAQLKQAQKKLANIETRIMQVAFLPMKNAKTEEDAAAERKLMAKFLNQERAALEAEVEEKAAAFQEHKQELLSSAELFDILLLERDEAAMATKWLLQFSTPDPASSASAAAEKDWYDVRLSLGSEEHGVPPVALAGDLPEEAVPYEVSMRGVRFRRYRHGRGMCMYPKGVVYHGDWAEGRRHGLGTLYGPRQKYVGGWVQDERTGEGAEVHWCTGVSYEGPVALHSAYADMYEPRYCFSVLNSTDYRTGVMHGQGRMCFADGAVYEGRFERGRPNGAGKYTAPDGSVQEGVFRDGVLHGPGSSVTPEGDTRHGTFQDGVLEGPGTQACDGDTYRGEFLRNRYTGRGTMTYHDGDLFEGFFYCGQRHGLGRLSFGNARAVYDRSTMKDIPEWDFKYSGFWKAGREQARGMVEQWATGAKFYTTNGKTARFPRLLQLNPKQERREKFFRMRIDRREEAEAVERPKLHRHYHKRYHQERVRIQGVLDKIREELAGVRQGAESQAEERRKATSRDKRVRKARRAARMASRLHPEGGEAEGGGRESDAEHSVAARTTRERLVSLKKKRADQVAGLLAAAGRAQHESEPTGPTAGLGLAAALRKMGGGGDPGAH